MLIAVVAATLAWNRFTPSDRDILWAEDGRNFLGNAMSDRGPFADLFRPYAGYLHTIPRLIAGITVTFAKVSDYALWMTAGSCIAAGVMAAIVFVCSSAIVRWMPARILLAASTVLIPLAPREVLGNTANLHSLVFWTLCWVMVYLPKSRWGSIGLAAFVLLGTLTEIQSLFLLPFLFFRLRDRRRWLVRGAFLIGAAAQTVATLLAPRHHSANPLIGLPSLVYGYFFNAAGSVWVPQKQLGPFAQHFGIVGCMLLAVPFAVALVVILRFGSRRLRLFSIALVLLSIIVYCVSTEETPKPGYDYASLNGSALAASFPIRYGVVPSLLLCALIPMAVSVVVPMLRRRQLARPNLARSLAIAGTMLLCIALVVQFVPPTRRSLGPQWKPEVAAGQAACRDLPDRTRLDLAETINWTVPVPCYLLERG